MMFLIEGRIIELNKDGFKLDNGMQIRTMTPGWKLDLKVGEQVSVTGGPSRDGKGFSSSTISVYRSGKWTNIADAPRRQNNSFIVKAGLLAVIIILTAATGIVLLRVIKNDNRPIISPSIPQSTADDSSANTNPDEEIDLKDSAGLVLLRKEGVEVEAMNPDIYKPNPMMLVLNVSQAGDLKLNAKNLGNVSGTNSLSAKLAELFEAREKNLIYREGTKTVDKTVILKTPGRIRKSYIVRTARIIKDVGGTAILFVETSED